MIIRSEAEMLEFGRQFAQHLTLPAVIELVGDVGMGKTTFTRGLAAGLGVAEPVTSPSFTISKRYAFPLPQKCCKNYNTTNAYAPNVPNNTRNAHNTNAHSASNADNSASGELVHYDFYRLDDPGIMRDELSETISAPNTVSVVEWGGDVTDLLPTSKYRIAITMLPDGNRQLTLTQSGQVLGLPS